MRIARYQNILRVPGNNNNKKIKNIRKKIQNGKSKIITVLLVNEIQIFWSFTFDFVSATFSEFVGKTFCQMF